MWCSETHIYKGNKHWFRSKQIKCVLAVADTGLSPSFVINEALWRLFINIIIFLRSLLACCSPHWWIWQQQSPCESAQECPAGHTVFVFPVPMLLIPLHIWELLALKTRRMHILIKKKSCALHLAFHRPLFLIITTLQYFFYFRKLLDAQNFSSVQSVYKNSSYFWAWKPNIDTKKLKLHFCHLINHEPVGSPIESMH